MAENYPADIISLNQSTFVPGRFITDNVILAYELTHFMQNKRKGSNGYASVKLDMSKAYECGMGFPGEDDGENGI